MAKDNQWIKQRIADLGKTGIELAAALKVAQPRITDIYKGERLVKSSELVPLARFLEMPVDQVMARLGLPKPYINPNDLLDKPGQIDTQLLAEIADIIDTTLAEHGLMLDARAKFLLISRTYNAVSKRAASDPLPDSVVPSITRKNKLPPAG